MTAKFILNTLYIENNHINPIYYPESGVVVDKDTETILHRLPENEITKFFYLKMEFKSYKYANYYQPATGKYKREMISRIYDLVIYLNVDKIMNDKDRSKTLCRKLTYYLTLIQMRNIQSNKDYHTDENNIEYFIDYRNSHNMFFFPWYYVKMNNNAVFDILHKKAKTTNNIPKILFKRTGGIIESNNVGKLIDDHFRSSIKTLVIMPNTFTNLWPGANILTFDKLITMNETELNFLKKQSFDQIIIHECYQQLISHVKSLAATLNCQKIWIINTLPLKYYFSNQATRDYLTINDVSSLTNLWLCMDVTNKKKYKTEIIRLLFTKFNQYYTVVNYRNSLDIDIIIKPNTKTLEVNTIKTIKIAPTQFEQYIYDELNACYLNWKNKLTNDKTNKYSFATLEKTSSIESKMFETVVSLIMAIMPSDNIHKFFEPVINDTLIKTNCLVKKLTSLLKIYKKNKNHCKHNTEGLESAITELTEKKDTIINIIKNYTRYQNGQVYQELNDEACPVCYSTDKLVKTKLICGHCVCIECIVSSLKNSSKCPVCNEFVNTQKIAIVKESLDTLNDTTYTSNLTNFLRDLDKTSIVVTNIPALINLDSILNITQDNIPDKLKKMHNVENVILFTTPVCVKNNHNDVDAVVNYFRLMNNRPNISRIIIDFSK